jgi:uracil-DNA glycosylase
VEQRLASSGQSPHPLQQVTTAPPPETAKLDDPRAELIAIARSLRVHMERLEDTGAWGVRRADEAVLRPPGPEVTVSTAGAETDAPAPGGARLVVLANEAKSCTRCGLHAGRGHSVFARGSGVSGVAFVGEGPGEEEDRQGLPFVGPAGQLLDRMIAAMQLARDDVYVCNIVKCRPPKNRKPEADEMAQCMPFLAGQLEIIKPKVIVALGATAVQGLLGPSEGITRMRGQWKSYGGKIPVMPTFHPAYLLRQPQAKREVWRDLQEVLRELQNQRARD